jgi:hypothetical protein
MASGQNRLWFKAVMLLWEWDAPRLMSIISTIFRLGIQTRVTKEAKGEVIPKPNKPDYGVAKAFRVNMLFNFLGQVVEKVAANSIAEECKPRQLLHDGKCEC